VNQAPPPLPLPSNVEEVDTRWLASVIDGVTDSKVTEVLHGTATKIRIELTFSPDREKQTVWVKSGMEPHAEKDRLGVVFAGEAHFYANYGGRFDTRTPECLFAGSEPNGQSVVVLSDLAELGAQFIDITSAGSESFVAKALEAIARYQAASWLSPELQADEWLRKGGSHFAYDLPGWLYTPERWELYSQLPRFESLHPSLRDRTLLERVHRYLLEDFFRKEPWALCHGDCHFGQSYLLPNGEVRLIDWQAVQTAHWSHDVAYFMAGALSPAGRRACERDLLEAYWAKLGEFGVERPPSGEQAWDAYRAAVAHGIGWTLCPPEMQPEENCAAMTERFSQAMIDLNSVDAIQNMMED